MTLTGRVMIADLDIPDGMVTVMGHSGITKRVI